ncbi:spermatogenesis-defective protein 39 homolog isoform X1 [Xyrauchen texanus]|uniref:spermatogenesis-defective protein 39 homolog isoform X1 n=1 Tax=Xyrauchen texanus TaxID=154827 RepID=UPI0022423A5A|nr:spermatogenesis-defective protein 39 homolog isoform X1 [Xyrauchen texanus]XP_051955147.1 spermatogenesis-defective protein 39 homolog isoform X1 [Xyrauchen texanus]
MTRAKPEDDEYWNSSKFKAFTFDDDDDEFSRLKESKRAVNSILVDEDEDEDDVERVNWSGEPVGSISWSVKETASSIRSGSEQSFPKIDTTPSLSKQGSGYSLSALFKAKSKPGGFQSFSESFSDTSVRTYAPELQRPRSDGKDFVSDLSLEETVRRMQKGRTYSLEKFRSLQDKLLLLDEAVAVYDGNVITAVTLTSAFIKIIIPIWKCCCDIIVTHNKIYSSWNIFLLYLFPVVIIHIFQQQVLIYLKKSLSKEILFRELMARDVALHHYVHYLKEMGEQKLLVELLKALGRTEDMALMQYKEHLNIKDEGRRRDFLKNCLSLPFSQDDATHVQDHYTLLERQIIIEASDKKAQEDIFKKFPRKASILNMPIITTLYYSCFYHYGEPEGTYSSPANIRKTFRISEKQYILTSLGARAKLKSWFDVDSLFNTKNWLGYTKKRSPIGFHRVVDILQKNNAPVQVLEEYMNLIDDPELKLSMALKYKCHDIVINTYRDLKDRHQLTLYKEKLDQDTVEYRKIQKLLNDGQIRWKN